VNPAIDPALFRQLMGRFATGVTVVTVVSPDGTPSGMTVNSLSSVSLDPPLVSICIDRGAVMHAALTGAPGFVVNILRSDQEAVSRRFAEDMPDRFDGVGYGFSSDGHPILDGVLAHLECAVHASIEAGDHSVLLGRVVGGVSGEGHPLLFYQGGYGLDCT
jgi:flavin reductase (DIM6/NTAB) family NADH-FMN oxidoreductase RutF